MVLSSKVKVSMESKGSCVSTPIPGRQGGKRMRRWGKGGRAVVGAGKREEQGEMGRDGGRGRGRERNGEV